MLTVFVNRNGNVIFTYPNVDLCRGDAVRHNGVLYLVCRKTFVTDGGFYEVLLHESDEE